MKKVDTVEAGTGSTTKSPLNSNYRRWLFQLLTEKKRNNPRFSLRALANSVGVSPATLSQVLSGKRPLTERAALKIANRLQISTFEKDELLKQVSKEEETFSKRRLASRRKLENDVFKAISDWQCYAITELAHLPDHSSDPHWIAERLAIPLETARETLKKLQSAGILKVENGKLIQVGLPLSTSGDDVQFNRDIQRFHQQMLVKASRAIEEVGPEQRPISTIFMTLNQEDLDAARESLRAFRRQFVERMEGNPNRDRLYALCMQLFPVDRRKEKS